MQPAASPARRQVGFVGFWVLHCWRPLPSASPACRQVSWWVLLGLHGESGMPVRWWLGVLLRHRGESGMPAVRYAGGLRVCFILFFSIHLGGAPLEFRWLRHAAGRTPPCMGTRDGPYSTGRAKRKRKNAIRGCVYFPGWRTQWPQQIFYLQRAKSNHPPPCFISHQGRMGLHKATFCL